MTAGLPTAAALHTEIGDALARLVAALQVPVLILAVLVLILVAVEVGRYVGERLRRRSRRRLGELRLLAQQAVAQPGNGDLYAAAAPTGFAATALRALAAAGADADPVAGEEALADYELAAQRHLDRTRLLVRAGPAIGLMGTLIPLAPGLKALGEGDMIMLASELRIAFAATVIGLLVGTISFALTLSRTRMYTEDLTALERAATRIARPGAGR